MNWAGFFEYHTHDVTADRIDQLLRALPDGNIEHARVLAEGGHGAYLHKTVGFANISAIIATGPKRRMMAGSRLPITWGAPWGRQHDDRHGGTARSHAPQKANGAHRLSIGARGNVAVLKFSFSVFPESFDSFLVHPVFNDIHEFRRLPVLQKDFVQLPGQFPFPFHFLNSRRS